MKREKNNFSQKNQQNPADLLKLVLFFLIFLSIPLFAINVELTTDRLENTILKVDSPITIKFPQEIYDNYQDIVIQLNDTVIYSNDTGANGFSGEMYMEGEFLIITLLSNSKLPPMTDYSVAVSYIDPDLGSISYTNFHFSTMFNVSEKIKIANTLITFDDQKVIVGLIPTMNGLVTLNIFSIDGIPIRTFQKEGQTGKDLFFEWDTKDKWGNYVANSYYLLKILKPGGSEILPLIIRK